MSEPSEPSTGAGAPDARPSGDVPPKPAEPEAKPAETKPAAEPKPAETKPAAEPKPVEARPGPGDVLIEASGLTKYYGDFTAIRDVSFTVRRGEVVAFLGPNGAGKSTTMRCLTGVQAPDAGVARLAGLEVLEHRVAVARRLGYLPENGPLYEDMTPRELLQFLGEARGLEGARLAERIDHVRETLSLASVMGKAIHKLSRGFRQRVGLAQALLHDPDALILDEPTNGLDPNQIRDVRRTIDELRRTKAVLLSTHILQEVAASADRVVFIHDGRIVFTGTVNELRGSRLDLDEAFASHTSAGRSA
jgi:ABC-2 type transport system ATP-binding protein